MTRKPLRRKTPLRKASPKRAKELREYVRLNIAFALLPENQFCPVAASGVLGKPLKRWATETHHIAGRNGKRLLDFVMCLRVSSAGHTWIHEHGKEARQRGWLV